MDIPQNRLDRGFLLHQAEYENAAISVLRSGWYVLGTQVTEFEKEFADFSGAKYCVGLASGLDALWIAFKLLGVGAGDEVIVPANTYIASVMGVTMNAATPVFVEPDVYMNIDPEKIEAAITKKTKAILPVHLYGQACDMDCITDIAKRHHLLVIEDCAQSHGAKQNGKMTGRFGTVGCFSFYPSKNLGGFGEGGAIVTDDEELAQQFKTFRNYGSKTRYYNDVVGTNSRLDEMQAALLRVRLRHLDELNHERQCICNQYLNGITNPFISLPKLRPGCETVWHQFVIQTQKRRELMAFLKDKGIGTIVHYPIPPHLQIAYESLGFLKGSFLIAEQMADEVLSLPLYNGMMDDEVAYVIEMVNRFLY